VGGYPPFLGADETCYNTDRRLECLCRCEEAYGAIAFYTDNE